MRTSYSYLSRIFEFSLVLLPCILNQTGDVLLILSLEIEISRVAVQGIRQYSKNCCSDFLWGDDIDATLAIFSFHGYDANASKAVEKIIIDENDYITNALFAL